MTSNPEPIEVIVNENGRSHVEKAVPIGETVARFDTFDDMFGYHPGDLVDLIPAAEADDLPTLGEVIYREYEKVTMLWYDHAWQYWELKAVIELLDGAVHPVEEPGDGGIKSVLVAHQDWIDVLMLGEALGLRTEF